MNAKRLALDPRWRLFVPLAVALLLACTPPALAATPTVPRLLDVYPSAVGQITAEWQASTESSGGPVTYDLYRDTKPVTAATVGGLTPVAIDVSGVTTTVAAASDETTQSYTWYYAVVAKDGIGSESAPSLNMAPDPHGSQRLGGKVSSCQRCHNVHGASDFRDKQLCYSCHGGTSAAATLGAKSTLNIERGFYDYAGQSAGSTHRNAYMTANQRECSACHRSHASPYYYDNGVYAPGKSYWRLIRLEVTSGSYTYPTRHSDPQQNGTCFTCHGDDGGIAIGLAAGSEAHAATGGDHGEATYAGTAHGDLTVYPNDYPATNPAIQCLVCHDQHASATTKLLDYRQSGTDDAQANRQANLCFRCHDADSTESDVAVGYAAPFAWNDRDVSAEYGRASSHPTATAVSGRSLTCVNCHDAHRADEGAGAAWDLDRVADPSDITTGFAGTVAQFCLVCHDGAAPEATITATAIVPYTPGFSDAGAWPYFTGWDKSAADFAYADSGHALAGASGGTVASCENCHDPHGSDFARLTAWTKPAGYASGNAGTRENTDTALSREESLCLQCHGNGTVGVRAPGALDVATKNALTYAHPIATYTDRHDDTESAADLATRHAECVDCHDPHAAREVGGSATQDSKESTAGGALTGAIGVRPTYPSEPWSAPNAFVAERLGDDTTDYEAYLCFKCHSANTTAPSSQTSIALEFNPSNFSYHNVLGQSTGMQSAFSVVPEGDTVTKSVTWSVPDANTFLMAGWTTDSMMTCTDCHTNDQDASTQAKGPHGSSAEWLIDPDYPRDWRTVGLYDNSSNGMGYQSGSSEYAATDVICAKCHDLYGTSTGEGDWSNTGHMKSAHHIDSRDAKYCINCHTPIPHGWKRPRLLAYWDDESPYATIDPADSYALDAVDVSDRTLSSGAVSWDCSHCKTHAGKHTSALTSPWP